jgi:hypothetical protein
MENQVTKLAVSTMKNKYPNKTQKAISPSFALVMIMGIILTRITIVLTRYILPARRCTRHPFLLSAATQNEISEEKPISVCIWMMDW